MRAGVTPLVNTSEARSSIMPSLPRVGRGKALLYTACFAAITVTGTIYGAGLKIQSEASEVSYPIYG